MDELGLKKCSPERFMFSLELTVGKNETKLISMKTGPNVIPWGTPNETNQNTG